MPQIEITIGGRSFEVACQANEEDYLLGAARMLDVEAVALSGSIGRMPESRMLLMAGLMLADKTAGLEDTVRKMDRQLADMTERLQAGPVVERVEVPVEVQVEVPVVPEDLLIRLAELAAEAEALAEEIEARRA